MKTEKMTVTRALAELKLIDSKIAKSINQVTYVALSRGQKSVLENGVTSAEFEKDVKSNYDAVTSNIKRRAAIKSSILESNAGTLVTIGENEMTVSEAISRKQSIATEVEFLNKMRREYTNILNLQQRETMNLRDKLDALISSNFSNKNSKPSEEEIKAISEPYERMNSTKIVDPLGIKVIIDKLDEEIDEFLKNVDFILSESNTRTEIEINY